MTRWYPVDEVAYWAVNIVYAEFGNDEYVTR